MKATDQAEQAIRYLELCHAIASGVDKWGDRVGSARELLPEEIKVREAALTALGHFFDRTPEPGEQERTAVVSSGLTPAPNNA